MRRVIALLSLALALPMAAWADGIDLTNIRGTISVLSSGITSKGSQLVSFNGIQAPPGKSLGSVSYGTGALLTGSISGGGTFSDAGSYFNVVGKGNYGQPKGPIFTGAFVGPVTWQFDGQVKNVVTYELIGNLSGQDYTGHTVTGSTDQKFYSTQGQLSQGIGHVQLGTTHINSTPEPGTLGLLGTGLLGIAGAFRRKKSV